MRFIAFGCDGTSISVFTTNSSVVINLAKRDNAMGLFCLKYEQTFAGVINIGAGGNKSV